MVDWLERAAFNVEPPGSVLGVEGRWTAYVETPGFRPRTFRDYGATPVEALTNLIDYVNANPPVEIPLPTVDDIRGILTA